MGFEVKNLLVDLAMLPPLEHFFCRSPNASVAVFAERTSLLSNGIDEAILSQQEVSSTSFYFYQWL